MQQGYSGKMPLHPCFLLCFRAGCDWIWAIDGKWQKYQGLTEIGFARIKQKGRYWWAEKHKSKPKRNKSPPKAGSADAAEILMGVQRLRHFCKKIFWTTVRADFIMTTKMSWVKRANGKKIWFGARCWRALPLPWRFSSGVTFRKNPCLWGYFRLESSRQWQS